MTPTEVKVLHDMLISVVVIAAMYGTLLYLLSLGKDKPKPKSNGKANRMDKNS